MYRAPHPLLLSLRTLHAVSHVMRATQLPLDVGIMSHGPTVVNYASGVPGTDKNFVQDSLADGRVAQIAPQ